MAHRDACPFVNHKILTRISSAECWQCTSRQLGEGSTPERSRLQHCSCSVLPILRCSRSSKQHDDEAIPPEYLADIYYARVGHRNDMHGLGIQTSRASSPAVSPLALRRRPVSWSQLLHYNVVPPHRSWVSHRAILLCSYSGWCFWWTAGAGHLRTEWQGWQSRLGLDFYSGRTFDLYRRLLWILGDQRLPSYVSNNFPPF
jgi:hypothetical protein